MEERIVGTRELRSDLATHLRRAAAGQRVVVTSGGRALAALGPVDVPLGTDATLEALVASGLVVPPRRTGPAPRTTPVPIWSGVRLDRALREVRG